MSRQNQKQFSSFQRPAPRQGGRNPGTGGWRSAPQYPQNQRFPQNYNPGYGQKKNQNNNYHNPRASQPYQTSKKNYHKNNYQKGVFLNTKPRHAGAGLDFDNDTTMTGMPSPYSAKQWRRIQYLRQLRETQQFAKLNWELKRSDHSLPRDVDITPGPPVVHTPSRRYTDADMLDVPDNF